VSPACLIKCSLIDPALVSVDRYRGHRGRDTYLEYEGTVLSPAGDIEDVPFYARCAAEPAAQRGRLLHLQSCAHWRLSVKPLVRPRKTLSPRLASSLLGHRAGSRGTGPGTHMLTRSARPQHDANAVAGPRGARAAVHVLVPVQRAVPGVPGLQLRQPHGRPGARPHHRRRRQQPHTGGEAQGPTTAL